MKKLIVAVISCLVLGNNAMDFSRPPAVNSTIRSEIRRGREAANRLLAQQETSQPQPQNPTSDNDEMGQFLNAFAQRVRNARANGIDR